MIDVINREEVLRYLGYNGQEISDHINKIIDICREETINKSNPKYIYSYFNIELLNNEIHVCNTNLILRGNDIKEQLKECKQIAIMVVTLGLEIERFININENINLTKAIILDSCATTYVEAICDKVENKIKDEMLEKGFNTNSRYSPGYGDFPLDIQGELLALISSEKRIGVTISRQHLLFPRKSVTAIIGIGNKEVKSKERDCSKCIMYNSCNFKKGGKSCGYKGIK